MHPKQLDALVKKLRKLTEKEKRAWESYQDIPKDGIAVWYPAYMRSVKIGQEINDIRAIVYTEYLQLFEQFLDNAPEEWTDEVEEEFQKIIDIGLA